MAQLLALEWNRTEARLVLASRQGGQLVVQQAFSVPLAPRQPGAENDEGDAGERIAAALAAKGIRSNDVLVGAARTSFELRQLRLPAVPDDELPEMVHLQAVREFNDLDDRWLLDFVPIDATSGREPACEWRTVLLAAVRPESDRQIKDVCQSAGLKMRCLVPRAFAAASLVSRAAPMHGHPAGQPVQSQMLVELADEINLTVAVDGKVVLLRSTRFGGDSPDATLLLSEMRRTMAAAENQSGRKIESIVLFGRGESHAELASRIRQELETPTELFDPFAGLSLGRSLATGLPDHPERFAPLLGMLLAESEQRGHVLDFLHPRRPTAPPNRRRKYMIFGATVALLAAAYLIYMRVESGRLAGEVQELQQKARELEQSALQADKIRATAADLGKWAETDVVWLEKLRELCQTLPAADSAILRQLTFGPSPGGGEMRLHGFTKEPATIATLEDALRRRSRHVVDRESHEDHSQRGYDWQFETSVIVDRESP